MTDFVAHVAVYALWISGPALGALLYFEYRRGLGS
jgi:hypothetical protein